jgi:hypothetical protein
MTITRLPTILHAWVYLTLAMASTAAAQSANQQRLADVKTLTCSFSTMATGTWTGGTAAVTVSPVKRDVSFTNINVDEGTADSDSGFGGGFIVVKRTNEYLHFMQMLSSGPLYTTTVLARETTAGRLMAVHTRHEYTDVRLPNFTSRPEMYVGECTPGK